MDGLLIAITDRAEALSEDCRRADIIVYDGAVTSWRRRRCAALLLDDVARSTSGGVEFWIRDGRIIRLRTAQEGRSQRLWPRAPSGEL